MRWTSIRIVLFLEELTGSLRISWLRIGSFGVVRVAWVGEIYFKEVGDLKEREGWRQGLYVDVWILHYLVIL